MKSRSACGFAALFGLLVSTSCFADRPDVTVTASPCESTASALPTRPLGAPGGSAFAASLVGLDDDSRELAIRNQLASGNVPQFLRHLVPVSVDATAADGQPLQAVVCAEPDYLAVGSDEDYFLVPMRLATALSVAGRYGFMLPTRKLVDAIYAQSRVHLAPQPLPASSEMRSTAYYEHHNQMVAGQRHSFAEALGALTAGDKKDLVISNRLREHMDRVAIYGWHTGVDHPIQPLSTVHGWHYADYSHGVRLISATAYVGGQRRSIADVLADPRSASLFSDEGEMPELGELFSRLTARHFDSGTVFGMIDPVLHVAGYSGTR